MLCLTGQPGEAIARIRSDVPERDKQQIYLVLPDNLHPAWADETDNSAQTVRLTSRGGNGMTPEEVATKMNGSSASSSDGKLRGGSGYGPPGRTLLKRKRDQKDELDEKHVGFNESVAVASFQREPDEPLKGDNGRKRTRDTSADYPPPPRHPDKMDDKELQEYIDTLTDQQYEAFMEDYDLESSSDTDDEDDKITAQPGDPAAPMFDPMIDRLKDKLVDGYTAPEARQEIRDELKLRTMVARTELPDEVGVGTPLDHVGQAFAMKGPHGSKLSRTEQKAVAAALANPSSATAARRLEDVGKSRGPERASMLQRRVVEGVQRMSDRRSGRELELFGSDMFQIEPRFDKRECLFVVGPQGAGKSYFCGQYARRWREQHPDGEVIVFSQLLKDEAIDRVGVTRVQIDNGLVENPYDVADLGNCLVIFDDIDKITNAKLRNAVRLLCDQLLEVGRKENVWVIRTSHQLRNWSATRSPLTESDKVVFFLIKGAPRAFRNYLKDYMCWPDDTIDRIVGNHRTGMPMLNSRWVVVCNHVPMWFCGEHLLCIV